MCVGLHDLDRRHRRKPLGGKAMKSIAVFASIVVLMTACEVADDESAEASTTTGTASRKVTQPKKAKDKTTTEKADDGDGTDEPVDNQADAEGLLVGIWKVDVSSVKTDEDMANLSEIERKSALEAKRQAMGQVAYEFAADEKLNIYLGGDSVQRGTYKLKRAEKPDPKTPNLIFVEASTVGPIGSKTDKWQVFVSSNSLKMISLNGGESIRLFRGAPVFKPSK